MCEKVWEEKQKKKKIDKYHEMIEFIDVLIDLFINNQYRD
jgi:hypothetical protein